MTYGLAEVLSPLVLLGPSGSATVDHLHSPLLLPPAPAPQESEGRFSLAAAAWGADHLTQS